MVARLANMREAVTVCDESLPMRAFNGGASTRSRSIRFKSAERNFRSSNACSTPEMTVLICFLSRYVRQPSMSRTTTNGIATPQCTQKLAVTTARMASNGAAHLSHCWFSNNFLTGVYRMAINDAATRVAWYLPAIQQRGPAGRIPEFLLLPPY